MYILLNVSIYHSFHVSVNKPARTKFFFKYIFNELFTFTMAFPNLSTIHVFLYRNGIAILIS